MAVETRTFTVGTSPTLIEPTGGWDTNKGAGQAWFTMTTTLFAGDSSVTSSAGKSVGEAVEIVHSRVGGDLYLTVASGTEDVTVLFTGV